MRERLRQQRSVLTIARVRLAERVQTVVGPGAAVADIDDEAAVRLGERYVRSPLELLNFSRCQRWTETIPV
jgi:hypothetical protein